MKGVIISTKNVMVPERVVVQSLPHVTKKHPILFLPPLHQPPTIDENNISPKVARESPILMLNRLVCLKIWRGS